MESSFVNINSGLGRVLDRNNIEWLNVYSVDNVLQKICDCNRLFRQMIRKLASESQI